MQIRASKCNIKEVPKEEEKFFLKENHFQGYASSLVCYGLYFNNKLVQLMSFGKPRFNKNYQWEIIRDCSKKSLVVQGGVSKLWKYFLKNNQCHSCICYSYPHDKKLVTKYIDYCGFTTIKQAKPEDKVYFIGEWNGKQKRIDKSILERHGVDRLLKTKQGQDRTNEQILLDLGFEKKIEKGLSPQVDSYYPFSVVYRITDEDTGNFYIGMCEVEKSWDNRYLGSGRIWKNHLKKYPNHNYKREILKEDFLIPKETRDYEYNQIKKYSINGKIDQSTGCLNTELRTQGMPYINTVVCLECGGKDGKHKKQCSHYIKPKPCIECGSIGWHKKYCSHYISIRCPECGAGSGNHKKGCTYYRQRELCQECGGKEKHKKSCSQYKPKICIECNGKSGHHKETCSRYKKREIVICSECGSKNLGNHKKGCSKYREHKCPECGSKTHHKQFCSHYKSSTICSECEGKRGVHKKGCSKYKEKPHCLECGGGSGQHKKFCSQYKIKNNNVLQQLM